MLYDIIQDDKFEKIMCEHIEKTINYLFEKDQPFAILANIELVDFKPLLPEEIMSNLPQFTLFMLANYTYESATLKDEILSFEAGFGKDNFGSVVSVPVNSIMQIIVEDTPIAVNLSASVAKKREEKKGDIETSMDALLSNPENLRLLKKRKKK
ncbi:hypothetical protein [Nitrosophilus alvini]|uniref:hypothetical protein n=1 Tax=Nitrosophilus alvini TaxID=2714855 RepID=UPI00190992F4|nr:hypothetical protein [Nitrosophilus alvini]